MADRSRSRSRFHVGWKDVVRSFQDCPLALLRCVVVNCLSVKIDKRLASRDRLRVR